MPAIREGARGAVISGWGTSLPEKVLTNDELAATMDTSDEWIRTRTGIEERRIGGTTIGLSTESGRQALEMAGLDPERIDALVLATTTPDTQWGTAAAVQNELGLRCGAFDVNAACSGFVYGLVTAHGLIAMGADRVLVVGTDTLSRITDWDDGVMWRWHVAGLPATGHIVRPLAAGRCTVAMDVPWYEAPYLAVCRIALAALAREVEQ